MTYVHVTVFLGRVLPDGGGPVRFRFSALCLEQAAHSFLHSQPSMPRKYALHLVLAGNGYARAAVRVSWGVYDKTPPPSFPPPTQTLLTPFLLPTPLDSPSPLCLLHMFSYSHHTITIPLTQSM